MTRPRIVVTGGRHYGERTMKVGGRWCPNPLHAQQVATLTAKLDEINPSELAHGAADGADHFAALWAYRNGIVLVEFRAEWLVGPDNRFDPSAGPKRNRRMLDEFKPDLVVAFPGGRGTADCMKAAEARGIPVVKVSP